MTDLGLSKSIVVDVFDWSIRKARYRNDKTDNFILIGYAFSYNKFEILTSKLLYFKQRLISVEGADEIYSPCGQAGLVKEAKAVWREHNKLVGITYDLDITHKFQKPEANMIHNQLYLKWLF